MHETTVSSCVYYWKFCEGPEKHLIQGSIICGGGVLDYPAKVVVHLFGGKTVKSFLEAYTIQYPYGINTKHVTIFRTALLVLCFRYSK